MDDIYLVEIRLGKTKQRIRKTASAIAGTARITRSLERHPHLTLFGPMELLPGVSRDQILDCIGSIAAGFDPIPFTLDRFEKRVGMHGSVIALSVRPSDSLKQLTAQIARALTPLTRSHNAWDGHPEQKWYHVTVANHLREQTAEKIFSALLESEAAAPPHNRQWGLFLWIRSLLEYYIHARFRPPHKPVLLDETGLRITVMNGDRILAEYDLLEKCWITGDLRHNSSRWEQTLERYRRNAGFELTTPCPADPGDILLIADLHLGHANIIPYCSRPFRAGDTVTMDRVLIGNWNARCTEHTKIFHIGDLCYGPHARPPQEYYTLLRGDAVFISGNHDRPDPGLAPFIFIEHEGMQFCLVHDPADAPEDFEGWVIHGHHHNNDLRNYPFIDVEHKRINVSAEVIGYVPASLSDICETIRDRAKTGMNDPVLVNYPYVS
ncbi:2'-5' RNA ligase family protein [Methanoregula formicica]|uniref:Putative phosphoesterase or phosphohydrolase n=1 Tax=Methanoregula formicica (strain DSM 22288 / NBRC 105244 / SMSP) TaxID=593750 RepID=L0HFB9_METFS|nr:2'-5' RNA ligase family protein [Methanoregula formicica]AGB02496.1 putative phosphoesterase or phosphohydrolase [Methanoregula formicica SMSP]